MNNTSHTGVPRKRPAWISYELPLLACLALIWISRTSPRCPAPASVAA